jgi:hypothetical protein
MGERIACLVGDSVRCLFWWWQGHLCQVWPVGTFCSGKQVLSTAIESSSCCRTQKVIHSCRRFLSKMAPVSSRHKNRAHAPWCTSNPCQIRKRLMIMFTLVAFFTQCVAQRPLVGACRFGAVLCSGVVFCNTMRGAASTKRPSVMHALRSGPEGNLTQSPSSPLNFRTEPRNHDYRQLQPRISEYGGTVL